ncbi:E3 ubiquitin-protein ligase KCMF1-like isoform X3 [Tribolium madens]|uniref:E3 ubiquitin-protein ligase KCMF1-like isoform X3 n=1 Tax=Tribolium madens TaxID=41895 RepID=UPI001CF74EE1|nr:E3 ubiquitin-protein ligase KCMF1-like isoform X3 [Tribolium madens]
MSRHEGVSCDSCLIGNFRGRRYKCLICYDYDLCAACYEGGATNTRHTTDHPMQCIITRADFDFFYGGEALTSLELPQSYTCPYCSRMGFTDVTLQEHVSSEHVDTSFEVVCPLCAAMPGGDPNLMTDDFAGHLTLEHRTGPRDLISFLDEPVGTRHNVRRIPHNATHMGRGAAALRPRRSNMHFSSGGLSSLSPSSRETVDPIAELLSQLSGVRRSASNTNSSTPTQLQQLQMQLQLERQQVNAARQQLERFPRRQTQSQTSLRESHASSNSGTSTLMLNPSPVLIQQPSVNAPSMPSPQSQFLLVGLLEELSLQSTTDLSRQDRSQFVQELVLSSAAHRNGNKVSNEKPNIKTKLFKIGDGSSKTEISVGDVARPVRQRNIVLRGRARSDAQNSRRRAEANRISIDPNANGLIRRYTYSRRF